jgi:hypothetical protein
MTSQVCTGNESAVSDPKETFVSVEKGGHTERDYWIQAVADEISELTPNLRVVVELAVPDRRFSRVFPRPRA